MSVLRANFAALVDKAMSTPGRSGIRPVIEKELLHYDILFALDRRGLLKDLVFQGGTSLKLCYGSHRFSEDLDFAAGGRFDMERLSKMADALESYLGDRYGLEVRVKSPKERGAIPLQGNVMVDKWQVSITTSPDRKDLPRQRIKIEVATVPAHEPVLVPLRRNYDFLPTGYEDVLIHAETMDEVLADKLLAFPVTLDMHVRYRDIWDIQWLRQQGAAIRPDLVERKISDYGVEAYPRTLERAIDAMDDIIHGGPFRAEMTRFLPQDRIDATFGKDGFLGYLSGNLKDVFRKLGRDLSLKQDDPPAFEM